MLHQWCMAGKGRGEGLFPHTVSVVVQILFHIQPLLYRVIFLTGPPLKMSLDWPPLKMPRLAPPKSCKYKNHIKVLRHLDFF